MIRVRRYLLLCIVVAARNVVGQQYENVTDLRTSLLSSYSTDVKPLNNYSDILYVKVTLNLYSQPDINPIRGSISTGLILITEWVDERITWTPSQHNGIENILIKSSEVWLPSISIVQSMEYETMYDSWRRVQYRYNGTAIYSPGDVYETSCEFYMKFWPFDKQTCFLSFYSTDYELDQLKISPSNFGVDTLFYVDHAEWKLDTDSIEYRIGTKQIPSITYKLQYTRQPVFYLLTVILPMNGIAALSCFVFLIPSESGGRIGYSVTIMLSLAVFLTVVSDELPKTSDPIPVMCIYILLGTIVNMLVTILVILNTEIYRRGKEIPIPWFYRLLIKISCQHRRKVHAKQQMDEAMTNVPQISTDGGMKLPNQQDKNVSGQPFDSSTNNADTSPECTENITWQDVSKAIDKVLFWLTIVTSYIPSIILLIYVASASDYHSDSVYWAL